MSQGFTSQLPIPLPVAQGGTGVTTSTGTTNVVLSDSPTLTTPRITTINDSTGAIALSISGMPSTVNYLTTYSSSTGSPVQIFPSGSDSNIGLQISTKGASPFAMVSNATSNQLTFYAGTSSQRVTNFNWADVSSNQTVTWPNLTGTVNMGLATGGICAWVNFDGGTSPGTIRASSNVTSVTRNSTGNFTVNITNALADANYAVSITTGAGSAAASDAWGFQAAPTSTAFRFATGTSAGANTNYTYTTCTIVR